MSLRRQQDLNELTAEEREWRDALATDPVAKRLREQRAKLVDEDSPASKYQRALAAKRGRQQQQLEHMSVGELRRWLAIRAGMELDGDPILEDVTLVPLAKAILDDRLDTRELRLKWAAIAVVPIGSLAVLLEVATRI